MPIMQSDIMLTDKKSGRKLIIDAKFYANTTSSNNKNNYEKDSVSSGNIYQIFTYVVNESRNCNAPVSGMLLYAMTLDDKLLPKGFSQNICGFDFTFRSLDLSGSFETIKESLDGIAEGLTAAGEQRKLLVTAG